jgi:hypothetical protein
VSQPTPLQLVLLLAFLYFYGRHCSIVVMIGAAALLIALLHHDLPCLKHDSCFNNAAVLPWQHTCLLL